MPPLSLYVSRIVHACVTHDLFISCAWDNWKCITGSLHVDLRVKGISNFQNVKGNSEISYSYNGIEIYYIDWQSRLKLFCSSKVWIGM